MAIEKEVNVIISAVDQYSDNMLGFNSKAFGVIAAVEAIAAAVIAASVNLGEFAVKMGTDVWKSATDFHDAMYNVEAVAQSFNTSGEDISAILEKLTQKFPITGEQAGAALQMIAQMGYGSKEQLDAVSNATNELSIATGTNLQTSVEGTLSILNSFGLSIEETERVTNLMAATAFTSAASVSDLSIAMRYAGSMSDLAGISVEETAGMIGLLKNKGLEASQAGTTLRMALAQLFNETEAGTAALAKYGLTYADVNPEVNSLSDIIGKFEGKTITAKDATDIFGVRAAVLSSVINDGKTSFDNYITSITGTSAAADAYLTKLQTWKVVQENVIGSIDLFKNKIGEGVVDAILHMIGITEDEGVRGVINQLTMMEDKFGSIGGVVEEYIQPMADIIQSTFKDAFTDSSGLYDYIALIAEGLAENLKILLEWGSMWAEIFVGGTDDLDSIQIALHVINGAMLIVNGTIALIHDTFAVAYNVIALGINSVYNGVTDLIIAYKELKLAMLEWMDKAPMTDFSSEISQLKDNIAGLKKDNENGIIPYADVWLDDVAGKFYEVSESIEGMSSPTKAASSNIKDMKDNADGAKTATDGLKTSVEGAANSTKAVVEGSQEVKDKMTDASSATTKTAGSMLDLVNSVEQASAKTAEQKTHMDGVKESAAEAAAKLAEGEKALWNDEVAAKAYLEMLKQTGEPLTESQKKLEEHVNQLEKAKTATNAMTYEIVDGVKKWTQYTVETQKAADSVLDLSKSVNDMSKNEFSLYSEKFKADLALVAQESKQTHEVVMANIEWKAKLDIAEVEANAKVMEKAFESVGKSVESTSAAATSMFDSLANFEGSTTDKWFLQDVLQDQMELQAQALETQKSLIDAQVKYLNARTEKLNSGTSMITVTGDGLKPHLKAIMIDLFEAIKVDATEEGLTQLMYGMTV